MQSSPPSMEPRVFTRGNILNINGKREHAIQPSMEPRVFTRGNGAPSNIDYKRS
jgi:hypothetical protein